MLKRKKKIAIKKNFVTVKFKGVLILNNFFNSSPPRSIVKRTSATYKEIQIPSVKPIQLHGRSSDGGGVKKLLSESKSFMRLLKDYNYKKLTSENLNTRTTPRGLWLTINTTALSVLVIRTRILMFTSH